MKILIVTNELDISADLVLAWLTSNGHEVFRFNTEKLGSIFNITIRPTSAGPEGEIHAESRHIKIQEIDSVYYRRPVPPVFDDGCAQKATEREYFAAIRGLWIALKGKRWVNYPQSLRAAESKLDQLTVASSLGLTIPKTLVTNDSDCVHSFLNDCGGRLIHKPFSANTMLVDGQVMGVFTRRVEPHELDYSANAIKVIPCLFQEEVRKLLEIRVTVVGRSVYSAAIHSQENPLTECDWRRDALGLRHEKYNLPSKVEQACIDVVCNYNLSFGTIDLILRPDGEYVFLELNPNGEWSWIENLVGLPITESIGKTLLGECI